jgi:hypothetical protein
VIPFSGSFWFCKALVQTAVATRKTLHATSQHDSFSPCGSHNARPSDDKGVFVASTLGYLSIIYNKQTRSKACQSLYYTVQHSGNLYNVICGSIAARDTTNFHCTMTDNGENGSASATTTTASKVAVQMTRMRDANVKYKNLLKMAKERIEQQEEELKRFRGKIVEFGRSSK